MGVHRVTDGGSWYHWRLLWYNMRMVVVKRESRGGCGRSIYVLAVHLQHVCDGELGHLNCHFNVISESLTLCLSGCWEGVS